MEGQQLPKATMNSFIKANSTIHYSADFITRMLMLSKEFVVRLSDKSNQMCEKVNKKTISAEHLEAALQAFGLGHHLQNLKELGTNIKQLNQQKREANQRLQEIIQRQLKEEKEKKLLQEPHKKMVVTREKFEHIEVVNVDKNSEDFDYQELARVETPKKMEQQN